MTHPLPDFPPLFPRGEWWRLFFAATLEGASQAEAICRANASSGIKPREWLRFYIAGAAALSLPVSGGASALKNRPSTRWTLAPEAQRESRKISATLATAYGRSPFFHPLRDCFEMPFSSEELAEGVRASEVCREAFRRVAGVLNLEDTRLIEALRVRMADGDGTLGRVCADSRADFHPDLSIIDTLCRLGPDAIFTLLPSF